MAVYIYEKDAFDKMVKVEGEEFRCCKSKNVAGICSFDAFLEEWLKVFANNSYLRNRNPGFGINVNQNGAIWGWHGWNRYIVLSSGEITFLMPASNSEYIEKAKKAGFRMFGEHRSK